MKSKSKISVAAVSAHSKVEDQNFNLNNILKWMEKLTQKGADFILFPEMSLSGYINERESLAKIMQEVPENLSKLLDFSKNLPSAISLGYPLCEKNYDAHGENRKKLYIAQSIIHGGKIIHTHRKTQLSPRESLVYTPGKLSSETSKMSLAPQDSHTATIGGVTFANQICFETHFPEITAYLEKRGAEIILMPFASPGQKPRSRAKRLEKFLPARAYDNSVFVMSCNNVALNKRLKSPAISLILDPRGNLIRLTKGWRENHVMAEIDIEVIEHLKSKKMSYFRQFAPNVLS